MGKKQLVFAGLGIIFLLFAALFIAAPHMSSMQMYMQSRMSMDEKASAFGSLALSIQEDLRPQVKYRCCLKMPCILCITKRDEHGEGASCDCIKDIMEGHAPCNECIGGILRGEANPYMGEYYATAIAEEIGEEHLPLLKEIIAQKYGTPVEKQV